MYTLLTKIDLSCLHLGVGLPGPLPGGFSGEEADVVLDAWELQGEVFHHRPLAGPCSVSRFLQQWLLDVGCWFQRALAGMGGGARAVSGGGKNLAWQSLCPSEAPLPFLPRQAGPGGAGESGRPLEPAGGGHSVGTESEPPACSRGGSGGMECCDPNVNQW